MAWLTSGQNAHLPRAALWTAGLVIVLLAMLAVGALVYLQVDECGARALLRADDRVPTSTVTSAFAGALIGLLASAMFLVTKQTNGDALVSIGSGVLSGSVAYGSTIGWNGIVAALVLLFFVGTIVMALATRSAQAKRAQIDALDRAQATSVDGRSPEPKLEITRFSVTVSIVFDSLD